MGIGTCSGSFRSSYSFKFLSEIRSQITDRECGRGLLEVSGERKCELVMSENGEEWIREGSMVTRLLQGEPSEMGGREVQVRTS